MKSVCYLEQRKNGIFIDLVWSITQNKTNPRNVSPKSPIDGFFEFTELHVVKFCKALFCRTKSISLLQYYPHYLSDRFSCVV